uniref:Uncharacterized protein n=1 Tax=Candidatus Kentrum eta TaxID=2126337 RepID=A0A450UXI4_9GAMM|nr:MAG: hypothetical protein BECKH772A_GA0070896_1001223 [Candidatus Kentron sp. H]VFJ89754.1 MAG: hypothetical protein BECKH772B_GA0070898_1000635 [Candidatus Kentron sp. H]VFJ97203.1 MAG: hypothetical protein BECKH772C_GA0070978_1001123 [Candidatus Kentron sp. H]
MSRKRPGCSRTPETLDAADGMLKYARLARGIFDAGQETGAPRAASIGLISPDNFNKGGRRERRSPGRLDKYAARRAAPYIIP